MGNTRNEDLKVGDLIQLWCGVERIARIEPYRGPLTDIVFAIAYFAGPGNRGFSLEIGGYTDVL